MKVMGIVNVTPDSFSDGGRFFRPEEAVRRARNLIAEGADILDLGGESTRPGATPLAWNEEWSRLEPVLSQLVADRRIDESANRAVPVLSVDTYHPETAERALAAGASMINCVYEESVADMLRILEREAARGRKDLGLVLPFRLSSSFSNSNLNSNSLTLYLDPMIGFGTTREEDVELLRSIAELKKHGRVLIGASRKRIVKKLIGEKTPGKDLAGNLAIVAWAHREGADAVRVHDVKETVQLLRVLDALSV